MAATIFYAFFQPIPEFYQGTIDNLQLNRIARLAGAPMDKGAGVDLFKKLGDAVAEGDPLYTVYAQFEADFYFARTLVDRNSGYRIGGAGEISGAFVEL